MFIVKYCHHRQIAHVQINVRKLYALFTVTPSNNNITKIFGQHTLCNDDIIRTSRVFVQAAGVREDLGTVDSSVSGLLWFDKQSVR